MHYDTLNSNLKDVKSIKNMSHNKLGDVALVIEIQDYLLRAALVRDNSIIVGRVFHHNIPENILYDDLLNHIYIIANAVLEAEPNTHPVGIGVCAGGSVDIINQTIRYHRKVNDVVMEDEMSIAYDVSSNLLLPTCLLSSCKAGIIGEHWYGDAGKFSTSVYLYITDDGIGTGVMHDSHLLIGEAGRFGGAGHTIVDTQYNLPCTCGGLGHWKAYMIPKKLVEFYSTCYYDIFKQVDEELQELTCNKILDKLFCCFQKNIISFPSRDKVSRSNFDEYFYSQFQNVLSNGIMNVVALYNPGIIILDGPLVKNHNHYKMFHNMIIRNTNSKLFQARSFGTPVVRASKNEGYACLMGMAAYVIKLKNDSGNGMIGEQWHFPKY